jgi:hypothetical protein
VDDVKNYVLGRDGSVHDNLIEKLARGEKPTHEDIADVSVDSMPDRLVGEDLHPVAPKNMYDRLLQVGFKKLVEPWSSFLSRQPIFLNQFREEKAALQEFVDKGIFTADQAKEMAVQRAARTSSRRCRSPRSAVSSRCWSATSCRSTTRRSRRFAVRRLSSRATPRRLPSMRGRTTS